MARVSERTYALRTTPTASRGGSGPRREAVGAAHRPGHIACHTRWERPAEAGGAGATTAQDLPGALLRRRKAAAGGRRRLERIRIRLDLALGRGQAHEDPTVLPHHLLAGVSRPCSYASDTP